MVPPIPTRGAFTTMLAEPPEWLRESLVGLTESELDVTPFAGKWSYHQQLNHIVDAALDWTGIV